jgi:hypothetical protein
MSNFFNQVGFFPPFSLGTSSLKFLEGGWLLDLVVDGYWALAL